MITKYIYLIAILGFMIQLDAFSQGTVRGKITDENGEVLIGATIVIKSQPSVGTITDLNGQFSIKISSGSPEVIIVTYVGYKSIEENVNPLNGEILIKDFNMIPSTLAIEETVVVGKAKRINDNYMEKVQIKSAISLNYISGETIKKIGDTNVSSAVARVSGVSTNGSFITVRGIGDRYMKTAINGMRIPTLDPFTNNNKLDMFPASLVDNIVLAKTSSPDLPGDWAGAYLSIETKDYPDKLSVNVETSFGYNQQSSLQNIVSSERSATDWLGYDNGLRDINHNSFVPVYPSPTTYQEFVALGLGDYYNSMGVTQDSWKNDGSETSKTYTKLGLAELGFLDKNKIDDPAAYTQALIDYNNSDQKKEAFGLINSPGILAQNKLLRDNWNTTTRKVPLNYSQSFSIGNQTKLFGRTLGYIAGFRYASSTMYDPNLTRHDYYQELELGYVGSNNWLPITDTINQKTSKETNGWSALLNLAYKINPNNSISFLFMPNLTGVNTVRDGFIYDQLITGEPFNQDKNLRSAQYYEERKQIVYQLKSENYIPSTQMRIETNLSFTNGDSKSPDFISKRPTDFFDNRFFRYLSEDLFDSKLSAELPVNLKKDKSLKLKAGAAYQYDSRTNNQYDYIFEGNAAGFNLHMVDSSLNRYYLRYDLPSNHSIGYSEIEALFVMLDYPINNYLRFSGGIRVEQSNIFSDISLYNSLNLPKNDYRRVENALPLNAGRLNNLSYLPSANLVIKLNQNNNAPKNLRLNFSQTVARPSIREISSYSVFDYELQSNVRGNPDLKMVQVNNYDIRLEAYFQSGDNISLSAFHKDFKNHIEFFNYGSGYDGVGFRWQNSPFNSYLNGIELEGRKNLVKGLELKANITLVNSRSKMDLSFTNEYGYYYAGDTVTHNMLGQAPYIINSMLIYTSETLGLSAAMSFNRQGPRLVIVGIMEQPDVYEMPRNLLDFKVSKKIGDHFNLSLKAQDILNSSVVRRYKFSGSRFHNQGYLMDYDKYSWGASYIFSVSYSL